MTSKFLITRCVAHMGSVSVRQINSHKHLAAFTTEPEEWSGETGDSAVFSCVARDTVPNSYTPSYKWLVNRGFFTFIEPLVTK